MEIGERNRECPVCGYEFPPPNKGLKWAAIALALMALFYFLSLKIFL